MNKISLILFIIQYRNIFFLFFEFHDVKTETSLSCKEHFHKQCPLTVHIKNGKK